MSDDTISRQAAINVIASMEAVGYSPYATIGRLDALLELNRLPSAERHGRWVQDGTGYHAKCSVCGEIVYRGWYYSFCPNCGAKMDEVSK